MSIQSLLEHARSQTVPAAARMEALASLAECGAQINRDIIEETVASVLACDSNPVVRHEAAFVLGRLFRRQRIRGNFALPALCESAAFDQSVVVRHEAVEALAAFPLQQARDALRKALLDPSPDVVATAVVSLDIQRCEQHDTDASLKDTASPELPR